MKIGCKCAPGLGFGNIETVKYRCLLSSRCFAHVLPARNSQLDPVLVLCRAQEVLGAMPQLTHTVVSVESQCFEPGPVAWLPFKTLFGKTAWHMDALREWIWSDLDVLMVDALREWIRSDLDVSVLGTWMLCGTGAWMLRGNGYGPIWTLL